MNERKKPLRREFFVGGTETDRLGAYLVRFRWDDHPQRLHPHWVDIELHEVTARTADGVHEYGSMDDGFTADPDKATPVLDGFVKWDGCSQFYTHEPRGPAFHFDDQRSLEEFFAAWGEARKQALVTTGGESD